MKVFLSWSGQISHEVACVFREWIPSVLQFVDPYVSSEDIDKGARWSTDIASELEQSTYGVLIITHDNIDAPWVAFEAGALSKTLDKARVSPFLFNIKRSELRGPLLQFQSTIFQKDDIFKLVVSINNSGEKESLDESRLERVFDVWWSELDSQLKGLLVNKREIPRKSDASLLEIDQSSILEELLELSRNNQRLLNDPQRLLPREHIDYLLDRFSDQGEQRRDSTRYRETQDALMYLRDKFRRLLNLSEILQSKGRPSFTQDEFKEFQTNIDHLEDTVRNLLKVNDLPRI